ncbi:hypothetical protein J42TS3_22370 [Paenibacillus vini]|uniref:Uncharacterized protein n=1 Tax=Paenibacillus vini TaxID=1476024 RepID=A0ABQ4MC47_9BACL|nr:hypothetical protein J42TS3_22370 [Paenibacillus vini]
MQFERLNYNGNTSKETLTTRGKELDEGGRIRNAKTMEKNGDELDDYCRSGARGLQLGQQWQQWQQSC